MVDSRSLRILSAVVACVGAACAAGQGDAPSPAGTLCVRLEEALPFRAPAVTPRRGLLDVEVDLPFAGARCASNGWAYLSATPAAEHPVTVLSSTVTAERATVSFEIDIRPYPPLYTGGRARFDVDLALGLKGLRGTYAGRVTGSDDTQAKQTWWASVGRTEPRWVGGVGGGPTASLTHVPADGSVSPVEAIGEVRPARSWRGGGHRVTPDRRPCLLFDGDSLKRLARSVDKAALRAWTDTHRTLLAPDALDAAAGRAVLAAIEDDTTGRAVAADASSRAVARLDKLDPPQLAVALASLAVAFDAAGSDWGPDARAETRAALAEHALRLAGQTDPPPPLVGPSAWLGPAAAPSDTQLAMMRAAAGLAALAAMERGAGDESRLQTALTVCARSVRRFLETGIGPGGAPTGQEGIVDAMNTVFPFVVAYRRLTGEDLAEDTGAAHAGLWGVATDGHGFRATRAARAAAWLAPSLLVAAPADAPALQWRAAAPASAWESILRLLTLPAADAPRPVPPAALTFADRTMNAYVLRSGWTDGRDFGLLVEFGAPVAGADALRGQFSLWGLGREGIRQPEVAPAAFGWPVRSALNVVQIEPSTATFLAGLSPSGEGHMTRLRIRREGGGSVGMRSGGFSLAADQGSLPAGTPLEESFAWRVIGVDYSRRSGAEAVVAVLDGAYGIADRTRFWEADLGAVDARHVRIDGRTATVQPGGQGPSMTFTFLYPCPVWIEYRAPTKERAGGRLRAALQKPAKSMQQKTEEQFDRVGVDIGGGAATAGDLATLDRDLMGPTGVFAGRQGDERWRQRVEAEAQTVYGKLLDETSSVKMGAGDRKPRARSSVVAVITVQSGKPPEVSVPPAAENALLKVGAQPIRYREDLFEFPPP